VNLVTRSDPRSHDLGVAKSRRDPDRRTAGASSTRCRCRGAPPHSGGTQGAARPRAFHRIRCRSGRRCFHPGPLQLSKGFPLGGKRHYPGVRPRFRNGSGSEAACGVAGPERTAGYKPRARRAPRLGRIACACRIPPPRVSHRRLTKRPRLWSRSGIEIRGRTANTSRRLRFHQRARSVKKEGSPANIGVPSGTANRSPVKRQARQHFENSGLVRRTGQAAQIRPISSEVKRKSNRYSTAEASPAARMKSVVSSLRTNSFEGGPSRVLAALEVARRPW